MEAAARLKGGRSAKNGISLPAPFFARQGCGSSWRAPTSDVIITTNKVSAVTSSGGLRRDCGDRNAGRVRAVKTTRP
jgi:hypothetical protein